MMATVESKQATVPVQGRWGWYALDYPAFREVKEFHRLLFRDRRASKRRERWRAKREENRTGPEPKCLGTDQPTYAWVLQEYRQLRHPSPTPEAVRPTDLPDDWREKHAALREFYGV